MSVPPSMLGFFCESGDLAVRLRQLFAIDYKIPSQLIAFLNKLFQLGNHPDNLSIADSLNGDGLCLGH